MAVSPVSFSKTPQAKDDYFANSVTEDSLSAILDVMGNDLGGGAKTLYSLDNGDRESDLLTRDTARSAAASNDFSAKGARIWITADGKVGYDASALRERLQSLAQGQYFEDSFTYAIQMGNGTISTATAVVRIAGVNDAPVITSIEQRGAVTEDGPVQVSGRVSASDVDNGDHQTYSLPAGGTGSYGSLALDRVSGAWTYTLDNGAAQVQALAQGESHVETFVVRVTDDFGAFAEQQVRVTVSGSNDGPVITSAAQSGAVTEDGPARVSGRVSASDVDNGDHQSYSLPAGGTGSYGSLALDRVSGAWTYTLDNGATQVQALAQGESHVETFVVRVTDDFGASAEQQVRVTVSGSNDGPVITSAEQTGAVTEDGPVRVSGRISASDVDNGDHQTYSLPAGGTGSYGSLALDRVSGAWTYTLDNGAAQVQALAQGESHVETFVVRVTDDFGAFAEQQVHVTVSGSNDGPVITSAEQTGAVAEDGVGQAAGQVTASDVDNGDHRHFALASPAQGQFGSFGVDAQSGGWQYRLANDSAAVQGLAAGEQHTETFTVRVSDDFGATADQLVSVVVAGSNDAPVAHGDALTLTEDAAAGTGNVLANDVDIDLRDVLSVATFDAQSSAGADVFYNGGGQFSYDPAGRFESLAQGDFLADSFTYTVQDPSGATSTATVDVLVAGVNDAPVVDAALTSATNEDAAPYTIDLLAGASDVDRGAVLHVAGFAEAAGQGGWSLDGSVLTINPNFFGEGLNDGDFANLLFNFSVVDEHGAAVAQRLGVSIEGITDAPSLAVSTAAGAAVNEMLLSITTTPAHGERVGLSFGGLPAGAHLYDTATGAEAGGGIANYLGTHEFRLVLPAGSDQFEDLAVVATGYRPDGSAIGAATQMVDLAYDVVDTLDSLEFSARDQNIWGNFDGKIDFHGYLPLIGGAPIAWNADTEEWENVDGAYWDSGPISLVDMQVDTGKLYAEAQAASKVVIDAAKKVFDDTAYVVDAAIQKLWDGAKKAFAFAEDTFWNTAHEVDQAIRDGFNAARNLYNWGVGELNKAADAFFGVATSIYNAAHDTWVSFDNWYQGLDWFGKGFFWLAHLGADATWALAQSAYGTAHDVYNGVVNWFDTQIRSQYDFWLNKYNEAASAVAAEAQKAFDDARVKFADAERDYNAAKAWVFDQASKVYNDVQNGVNDVLKKIADTVDFSSQFTVQADLKARAGLQVDVVLDLGSVDAAVQYQLATTTQYNKATDMLAITPVVHNQTTGENVAFETISPNAKFYVALIYDAGANFDVLLDGHLAVAGTQIYDLTPNSGAFNLGSKVSTSAWPEFSLGDPFAYADSPFEGSGLEPGKLVLVDFDSTRLEPFNVPFVEDLTKNIVSIELAFPTVQTEGKAAAFDPSVYQEGGLIGVDFSEISSALFNLVMNRIDYSPELRAEIPELGSLYDNQSLDDLVQQFLTVFSAKLLDVLDGKSEEVPVFLLDATDQTDTSLVHLNIFPDSVIGDTVGANTGSLGFYAAYGESAPVVKINIDIDQFVAVVVNEIVKAIIKAATEGAATPVLDAIPTINPLDLSFGIDEILQVIKVPKTEREEIEKFVDLGFNFQAADVDAQATTKFSQKFTLSVDDMSYLITLEDGTKELVKASDGHGLVIPHASSHDLNGDGAIGYSFEIVPTAMFSNDTELGLGVGYVLDFLKGGITADLKVPLGELLNVSWLGDVTIPVADVALGPLLRVQGDLDLIDVDLFESRFGVDLGSQQVDAAVDIGLVGVNPQQEPLPV